MYVFVRMCVCVFAHVCVVNVSKEQCASVVRAQICMLRHVQESVAVCGGWCV